MSARRRCCAWLALLPLLAQAAPPQTVYRCGADGRVYSQTPCADGKPVTVDDPRSASQQQAAREVAAGDAAQARQLADERRQRDAQAQRQPAGFALPAAPAQEAKKAKKPSKAASQPPFTASSRAPASAPAKR